MKQTLYLQTCCNRYGDFKVSTHYPNGTWSKWRSVLELWQGDENTCEYWLENANNRTPYPCELILDIDTPVTTQELKNIINKIEAYSPYRIKTYFSGSKGHHIHLLDPDIITMTRRRKELLIKYIAKADMHLIIKSHMIALENVPHWKTGNPKTRIWI